jgi:hypothetical protein
MALTKPTWVTNTIQSLANRVTGQSTALKQNLDKAASDIKAYINDILTVEIDALDAANVKNTGNQTIAGIKTFSASPIVPTPTTNTQAANKSYVDSQSPLTIPNDSLTELKMANEMKKDIVGGVTAYDTFAAHTAEKAAHAELANRTITVGVGKDFTTIQEAINSIKKRVDVIITINVDAGTYSESVNVGGFYGGGSVNIYGGNSLATAVNYIVNNFNLYNNFAKITINGFIGTSNTYPFKAINSIAAEFNYCTSTSTGTHGLYFESCIAICYSCLVSNKSTAALRAEKGSNIFSYSWTAGSGNAIGIYCRSASTIGKYGTQPQGTTAESADQGGAIR